MTEGVKAGFSEHVKRPALTPSAAASRGIGHATSPKREASAWAKIMGLAPSLGELSQRVSARAVTEGVKARSLNPFHR